MLRLIAILLSAGLFLTFGSFRFLLLRFMPEGRERDLRALRIVQRQFRRILRLSGVTYEVEGEENLPEDEAVLFVGNHRSFYDVMIGYTLVKSPTGFISKTDLEKYTTLKMWMERLHCLFLDRDNLKQNLKVILAAIKQIKSGISIWIYPEGTRSKGADPKELLPFKEGSFKIAEKTGCKIIPVAMLPTREIWEAHFPRVRKTHVRIRIGEPILLSALPKEDRDRIGEYTREKLIGYLEELEKAG